MTIITFITVMFIVYVAIVDIDAVAVNTDLLLLLRK